MKRTLLILLLIVLTGSSLNTLGQTKSTTKLFVYQTDEFWLNLHHFLHVLARAENKAPDAAREAVLGAPGEQERGLAKLSEAEKAIWRKAVTDYAQGPAKKDLVFDEPLAAVTKSLALAKDSKSIKNSAIDPSFSLILESAAPIYRKVWWKQHHEANRRWQKAIQPLVNKHGPAVLSFITHAYKMDWPAAGFPIHVAAYSNWAGAYSTSGNLLVLSSQNSSLQGAYELETIFHEAMHQWDDQMFSLLRAEAIKQGKRFPPGMSHSLVFFTAGEAVKRVIPGHIPYAEKFGIWQRGLGALKAPLEETWKPYLDGRGTRDEAIAAFIKRTGNPTN